MSIFFIIVFLLLISTFFEISETALLSFSKGRFVYDYGKEGTAGKTLYLKENAFAVVMVSLIMITVSHNLAILILGKFYEGYSIAIVSFVISALTIFSSLMGKFVVLLNIELAALIATYPVWILAKILYPITYLLNFCFSNLFKNNNNEIDLVYYKKEINGILETQEFSKYEEAKIIEHVLDLRETKVSDIMTPRTEFMIVDSVATAQDIIDQISTNNRKKRIVVIDEDLEEHVTGHFDLDHFLVEYIKNNSVTLDKFIVKPVFIPENASIYHVLELFKQGNKMIFAIDEYGSVSGLISPTDLYKDILGIIDQKEEPYFEKISNTQVIVAGNYNIRVLNRQMDWDMPDDNITIAGLIFDLFKHVPENGHTKTLENFSFQVIQQNKGKLYKVMVTKLDI